MYTTNLVSNKQFSFYIYCYIVSIKRRFIPIAKWSGSNAPERRHHGVISPTMFDFFRFCNFIFFISKFLMIVCHNRNMATSGTLKKVNKSQNQGLDLWAEFKLAKRRFAKKGNNVNVRYTYSNLVKRTAYVHFLF